MYKRTSIIHQTVELSDHVVTLYDAEHYGYVDMVFETLEKAEQCYIDTVAILTESYNKLVEAGWDQAENWEYQKPEEVISA